MTNFLFSCSVRLFSKQEVGKMKCNELLMIFKAAQNSSRHIRAEIRCSDRTAVEYFLAAKDLGYIQLQDDEHGILQRLKMESRPRGKQAFTFILAPTFEDHHASTLSHRLEGSILSFHAIA